MAKKPHRITWGPETTPKQSMHGIFPYISRKKQPNVGKYTSPMDGMGQKNPQVLDLLTSCIKDDSLAASELREAVGAIDGFKDPNGNGSHICHRLTRKEENSSTQTYHGWGYVISHEGITGPLGKWLGR